jgi:hypothetical protein
LCRSAEANHVVKPVTHQTEMLSTGLQCIVHNRGRWTNDVGKLECFELEEMDDKSAELVIPRKIMNSIW